jgi:hypothetical protein
MDFAEGAHGTIESADPNDPTGSQELSVHDVATISLDSDGDGVADVALDANGDYAGDNCPLTPNPTEADTNGDGIGDACTITIRILRPSIPSTSEGVVQVAILGGPNFPVSKIDPATVALHGAATQGGGVWSVPARDAGTKCTAKDINADGRADLVCQFKVNARLLPVGVSTVFLEARAFPVAVAPTANDPNDPEDDIFEGERFLIEAFRGQSTIDVKDVGNGN